MLANPVGLIIAAIVAVIAILAAAGYAIGRFRDEIIGGLSAAREWIKAHWQILASILGGPFVAVGLLVYRFRDKIMGALTAVWTWIQGIWAKVFSVLRAPFDWLAGLDLFEQGKRIILTLVDGIKSAAGAVVDAVKGVFGKVAKFLPFSDAEKGPLRHLTAHGRAFVETLAAGMDDAMPLSVAVTQALAGPLPVGPSPAQTGGGGGGRAGAGGGLSLSVKIDKIEVKADGGDPDLIAGKIVDSITDKVRGVSEEFDSMLRA